MPNPIEIGDPNNILSSGLKVHGNLIANTIQPKDGNTVTINGECLYVGYDTVPSDTTYSIYASHGIKIEGQSVGNSTTPIYIDSTGGFLSCDLNIPSKLSDLNGTLSISQGGTGLNSAPSMLTNLASTTAASIFDASPRPGVTGTLPISAGGTGATTAAEARSNLSITPDNIGAAPDGYGLGKNANTFSAEQKPTIADFTQTGWYRYAYDTSDNPYPGYGGIVQVVASDILLIQLAYPSALNYRKNSVSMRQRVDGSWQSWIELYSSGTVPVSSGGTGATTADGARKNLGVRIHENCSNTNFNTIKEPGTYYGYTGMTNAKFPNSISVLEVIQYSPDWVVQRQTVIGSHGNQTWERHWYRADTWTDWKQIYTSNEMAWKKASVAFSSGSGSVSTSGVTTSSTVLAIRGDSAMSGGGYTPIAAADCNSNGTIKMGLSNTNSGTYVVNLWWSK